MKNKFNIPIVVGFDSDYINNSIEHYETPAKFIVYRRIFLDNDLEPIIFTIHLVKINKNEKQI